MTIAVSDLTGSLTGILKEDYDLDIEKEERLKEKYELQFPILNFIERNFPNETIKTMSTGTHHLFWLVWL